MKKIIVVEDDPAIQDSVSLIFASADFQLFVFPDAHDILKGDYVIPDIFIIDKQLPGVDGLSLCKHLKADSRTKHIPVILISASPLLEKLYKLAGADNYIEKPFQINYLRKLVDQYIAH